MINNIPKISVLIICYKQEELIKRAINSLLVQKDYIYEICVSDDCSPDKTWEILKEYESQYPELFKLHRNNNNIGIFENVEQVWTMPTGDLVYRLAGDDMVPNGWFKTVIEYINNNNINYKNQQICIYGDFICQYANGDSIVYKNNNILKPINSLRLSIRGMIYNRGCVYSIHILKQFFKCSQGRSYIAESAQDRQLQLFAKKSYYIAQIANIYYAQIGVSTTINNNPQRRLERDNIYEYTRKILSEHGALFNTRDIFYFKFKTAMAQWYRNKGLKSFVHIIYYGSRCVDLYLSIKYFRVFKHFVFAILRRIPHTKPLKWEL